jgi:soluble lytic murein transglycosylase-like protein
MIARLFCAAALSGCFAASALAAPRLSAEQYDALVAQYAKAHGLPEKLIHRVIMRESRYNAAARNRSYWGLMQITYATARSMGYKGTPAGLLDPGVNLTYAVPYLANAYMIADRDENRAVRLYASGYYFSAKKSRLLSKLRTADSAPVTPEVAAVPAAQPSLFAMMFGTSQTVPSSELVATADDQTVAAVEETAEPIQVKIPLPPHRPRHLAQTVTANR